MQQFRLTVNSKVRILDAMKEQRSPTNPGSSRSGRRVDAGIDESASLPGKLRLLRSRVNRVERHFRGAGYNDASQDHRNCRW